MNAGGWDRNKFVGLQLHGRTLGVVGMGRIGQTMASRALAFGMNVLGFDPFINAETALDGQVTMLGSFDDLIASPAAGASGLLRTTARHGSPHRGR